MRNALTVRGDFRKCRARTAFHRTLPLTPELLADRRRVVEKSPDFTLIYNPANQRHLFERFRHDLKLHRCVKALWSQRKLGIRDRLFWVMLGDGLFLTCRFAPAATAYRQALRLTPHDVEARRGLAATLYAAGFFDMAARHYHMLIRAASATDRAVMLRNLACIEYSRGKVVHAISHYRQAIAADTTYAEAYRNLARVVFALNNLDESIDLYHKSMELDNSSIESERNIGTVFYYNHNYNMAEYHYSRVLAALPDFYLAHYNIGTVYFATKRYAAAAAAFRRALELKSTGYIYSRNTLSIALRAALEAEGKAEEAGQIDKELRGRLPGDLWRCLRPLPLRRFAGQAGWPIISISPPALPAPDIEGLEPSVRISLAADQQFAQQDLILAPAVPITVSFARYCSSALIIDQTSYATDKVYERPATSPTSWPIYFPPNQPTGFAEWMRRVDQPAHRFEEAVLYIGGSLNYGHFLIDTLGKLLVAEQLGSPPDLPVATFPLHGVFGEIAHALFPDRRFVDFSQGLGTDAILSFAAADVASNAPYAMLCHQLAQRAERQGLRRHAGYPDRIYLSRWRQRPRRHRVANEEEIAGLLHRRGFTTIYPETLSFAQTVALFSQARIIVTSTGAQYGNVIFSSPGTTYIELAPAFHAGNASNQNYDCLSAYCGVRLRRIYGDDVFINSRDPTEWYTRFPARTLDDMIAAALS